jgi:hypothetical protein
MECPFCSLLSMNRSLSSASIATCVAMLNLSHKKGKYSTPDSIPVQVGPTASRLGPSAETAAVDHQPLPLLDPMCAEVAAVVDS